MLNDLIYEIEKIDKNNNFIIYFINRLLVNSYRGLHISQHNRYDLDYIIKLLTSIYKYANDNFFEIPPGDYSEKKNIKNYDINKYPIYKNIVYDVRQKTGKGTFNSIKKNFFVDLKRMKLLDRTDDKKLAKLTSNAIELLELYNQKKYRILTKKFTDIIDENLFGDFLSKLVEFMWLYGYNSLSIYEYTFILNDLNINNSEKELLLRSYRNLENKQKRKLINILTQYADPKKYKGNKTNKRDFHNWLNESLQIFYLIRNTTYFQVIKENEVYKLLLNKSSETGIFSTNEFKRKQSLREQYLKIHKIKKREGYELHHIIPIKIAVNKKDMELIDNINNLIYIDNKLHKQIHSKKTYKIMNDTNNNKNKYLVLLNLLDKDKKIILENNKNMFINQEIKHQIIDYNKKLIEKYYSYLSSIS